MAKQTPQSPHSHRFTAKRVKHPVRLPSILQLTQRAAKTLWMYRQLFIVITLVYAALDIILVHGLASTTNVADLKVQLHSANGWGVVSSGLGVFMSLVSTSGNGSTGAASVYQFFVTVIASLALIWGLRQMLAGTTVRAKAAYYQGMYPLVPFVLVLGVVGLQLVPMAIGSGMYSILVDGNIVVNGFERLVAVVVFLGLAIWSLYMVASSLIALYIVTLPNMTPLKAVRSAKELTRHRRWTVLRKILGLPLIVTFVGAVVMVPIIIVATPLAPWLFFALSMVALPVVHTYMYTLYRELLND